MGDHSSIRFISGGSRLGGIGVYSLSEGGGRREWSPIFISISMSVSMFIFGSLRGGDGERLHLFGIGLTGVSLLSGSSEAENPLSVSASSSSL